MKRNLIILILLIYAPQVFSKDSFSCMSTQKNIRVAKIVGGTYANPKNYPWMLSINSTGGFCGASLISPKWALTAAHCVEGIFDSAGNVVNGQLTVNRPTSSGTVDGEQRIAVKVISHRGYRQSVLGLENDIALIKLDKAFKIKSSDILRIADKNTDKLFAKTDACATVTGWGTTSENGSLSDKMKQAHVPVKNRRDCQKSHNFPRVAHNQICAGYEMGSVDSCQGDSGGPLVVKGGPFGYLVAGIVSWGEGCARPGKFGVYTRVASYRDWIFNAIEKN